MAMANSYITCACARQIYLFLHFTIKNAQKIYWMPGCPSSRIIRIILLYVYVLVMVAGLNYNPIPKHISERTPDLISMTMS